MRCNDGGSYWIITKSKDEGEYGIHGDENHEVLGKDSNGEEMIVIAMFRKEDFEWDEINDWFNSLADKR